MKKLGCLLMVFVMMMVCSLGCTVGFAESAEMAPFVQTLTDAQVYGKAGGSEAADTLAAETVCGLIETVAEGGNDWFHVLYLNSAKKAAEGYLRAEDAKQLTEDELKALLEDMEKANEVLDLIDALDDYVKASTKSVVTAASADTTDTGVTNEENTNLLGDFYDKAMEKLGQVFNLDISTGLSEVTSTGEGIIRNATEAGKELLASAEKTGKELIGEAATKGTALLENAKKTGSELVDNGKNLLKTAKKTGNSLLDNAEKKFTTLTKDAKEAGKNLVDGVKNSTIVKKAEKAGADIVKSGKAALENAKKAGTDLLEKGKKAGTDLLKNGKNSEIAKEALKAKDELVDSAKKTSIVKAAEEVGKSLSDSVKNSTLVKKGTDVLKKAEKVGEQIITDSVTKSLENIDKKLDDLSKKSTEGSGKTEADNASKTETEGSEKKGSKVSELIKKVTKTVEEFKADPKKKTEELQKKLDDAKNKLDKALGENTGKKIDAMIKMSDLVKSVLNSEKYEVGKTAVAGLGNVFTESGFTQGLEVIRLFAEGLLNTAVSSTGK